MGRYISFIFGILLLSGNGCHSSTSPTEINLFPKHVSSLFPRMRVNINNIVFTHHYKYDTDGMNPIHTESNATTMTDPLLGVDFSVDTNTLISNKGMIDSLYGRSQGYIILKNITFNSQPDSSLSTVISGVVAAKFIGKIWNSSSSSNFVWRGHDANGNSLSYTETELNEYSYINCTDSTRIEIILLKK